MWRQVAATVDLSLADVLSDWFLAHGALSVSLDDALDQPLFEPPPGAMPLWTRTRVTGLFEGDANTTGLEGEARLRFGQDLADWQETLLEDQVWERVWLEHFRPMQFGSIWICPSGYEPPDPRAVNVHLDPGLAFGTGTHPTTALCLRWLSSLPLEGASLLDYGCGSGILAVAALCLGAKRAVAVDLDPQALEATLENARKNAVEGRIVCRAPEAVAAECHDFVVANILAAPLISLSSTLIASLAPGGLIGLSGLLLDQAEEVRAAYRDDIDFEPEECLEEWVLLRGRRRKPPNFLQDAEESSCA